MLTVQDAPIEAARGPQTGVEKIAGLIDAVLKQSGSPHLMAIGIGSTGPVDRERGAIQNPYTLPTWEDVDIVSPLAQRFHAAMTLENDADVAALGEAWLGAGRGLQRMAQVTVGTGIGVAFILEGQIYRGMGGLHAEGGHMLLDPQGPECYCGGRGCWEVLAAGPAMERTAREAVAARGGALLQMAGGKIENITGRMLVTAARQGDAVALDVIRRVGEYTAMGIINLIMTFLPDGVVLGGGVMKEYDLFQPIISAAIARHNVMAPSTQVKILQTQLQGQAGVLGAARAALNLLSDKQA
jgi:glucokinase